MRLSWLMYLLLLNPGLAQSLGVELLPNATELELNQTLSIDANFSTNQSVQARIVLKLAGQVLLNQSIDLPAGNSSLSQLLGEVHWKAEKPGKHKLMLEVWFEDERVKESKLIKVEAWFDPIKGKDIPTSVKAGEVFRMNLSLWSLKPREFELYLLVKNLKLPSGEQEVWVSCGKLYVVKRNSTSCSWEVPSDAISSNLSIYPVAKAEFELEASKQRVEVVGLPELGGPSFELVRFPSQLKFGDYNSVLIKFFTGNYDGTFLFLTYAWPKRVLCDFEGKPIEAKDYGASTTIRLEAKRGGEYYLSLPLVVKPNCDRKYAEGEYRIRVRAYQLKGAEWEVLDTKDFYIHIEGWNQRLCPEPEVRIKYEYVIPEPSFELLSAPSSVEAGKEFELKVLIYNPTPQVKNFTIYSYVYDGKRLVSEGYVEGVWLKRWDANEQEVWVGAKNSTIVSLYNRVKEPGNYTLKVRIKGVKDLRSNLSVLPTQELKINASMHCWAADGKVHVNLTNLGKEAEFLLVASQTKLSTHAIELNTNESTVLTFELQARNEFNLFHANKILTSCEVRVPAELTGQAVRPWNWFSALWSWITSLFRL